MALSSCQKIFYGLVLFLTLLLAGLIIAAAVKGYHYYREDYNTVASVNGVRPINSRLLQINQNTVLENARNAIVNAQVSTADNGVTTVRNSTHFITIFNGVATPISAIPTTITQIFNVSNQNLTPGTTTTNTNIIPNIINPNVLIPASTVTVPTAQTTNQALVAPTTIQNFIVPNPSNTVINQVVAQRLVRCKNGQALNVFGDTNYAKKSYDHWMSFIIVGAILLAIIALILLFAVCTDSLSNTARIILTVLGLMLLFALAVVLAIKASQTKLQRDRLYDELGCPHNDDLDIFYKLLIAAAVASFVLGALWLAFLASGLLGNADHSQGTGYTATHVNHNYNYDAPRVNAVKSSELLYAQPPTSTTHLVQAPITTTNTTQVPANTYATQHHVPVTTSTVHHVIPTTTTNTYTVPQSAERLHTYY